MDVDMKTIIKKTEDTQKEMREMAKRIVLVVFVMFGLTVLPLFMAGNSSISVPVVALFGMLYFFPLITFFLGMAIIWRKKFSVTQEDEVEKIDEVTNVEIKNIIEVKKTDEVTKVDVNKTSDAEKTDEVEKPIEV